MNNINTKEYWENRFRYGDWNQRGNRQTKEYAKANIKQINLSPNFNGSILDFGCALGDSIPIYKEAFPNAALSGIDISKCAIQKCKSKYNDIANFYSGDYSKVVFNDFIIASHVMEHITDDKYVTKQLLSKCKEILIFVPYKENPLYHEHVNYYEEDYYDKFDVLEKKIFLVEYNFNLLIKEFVKNLLKGRLAIKGKFSKQIIMFRIKA